MICKYSNPLLLTSLVLLFGALDGQVFAEAPVPPAPPEAVLQQARPAIQKLGPVIVENTEVDLGRLKDGLTKDVFYKFKNPTDQPIDIVRIQPACGCTAADGNPTVIPANGEVEIRLVFNTKGQRGDVLKSTTVFTSQGDYRVSFRANVSTDFDFSERMLSFGDVPSGAPATQPFSVVETAEKELKIIAFRVEGVPFTLESLGQKPYMDPANKEAPAGRQHDFALHITAEVPPGNHYGNVVIEGQAEGGELRTIRMPVQARVLGEFTATPSQFAIISAPGAKQVRTITVSHRNHTEFTIEGIEAPADLTATFETRPVSEGRVSLTGTFVAPAEIGTARGEIKFAVVTPDGRRVPMTAPYFMSIRNINQPSAEPRAAAPPAPPSGPGFEPGATNEEGLLPN